MRLLVDHRHRAHILALAGRKPAIRHRRQPDVGIETDLMRSVPGQHGSAARLRNIAQQKAGPAIRGCIARKFLDQIDHRRVAPATVARQPHRLPGGAIRGDRNAAGKTALRIETIGFRGGRGRQFLASKQVLGEFGRTGRLNCRHGDRQGGHKEGCGPRRSCKQEFHAIFPDPRARPA